jgi:tyrosinase
MSFTRQNVWELGGDWADPILWYARGVKAMKARALKEGTAWRFYGAIHGIDPDLWTQYGYLSESDTPPSNADIKTFWNQCQHGSWYFLPWHRGYLIALEAIIRDAVIAQGGPATWALPYWNYFKPGQDALPPAFASPDWPDGKGDNPLFVEQRYGPNNDGDVFVPMSAVNLDALGEPDFEGVAAGGSPGFGGVSTGFAHNGSPHGQIEQQPHDQVHGLVGGGLSPQQPGLMSDPDTAGLDPIFWLHHANIDRLWEVWRENPASHVDPTKPKWVSGPASIGQRAFIMPMPGGKTFTYTPGEMSDLSKLDYTYDDVSPPTTGPSPLEARMLRSIAGAPTTEAVEAVRRPAMAAPKNVELLGANTESIRLSGTEATTSVALDAAVQNKLSSNLRSVTTESTASAPIVPDRVFLNLENVRGISDATIFDVYINLPDGANPANYPRNLAGNVSLFGVRKASKVDDTHAGDGLTFVLEISDVIDRLHLSGALAAGQLHVKLVPRHPVPDEAQISIGRISIFRQGN